MLGIRSDLVELAHLVLVIGKRLELLLVFKKNSMMLQ